MQSPTTIHNHPKPSTNTQNHPQPSKTTHNHLQPPKNYPKKPKLVTVMLLHLDVNTEIDVDFHSGMK